ncbi:MAG: hypothetical protein QG635_1509, partial [Bacteroidota bacterium]|nr:hypothetical protein [Bacteroidota bacterium]
MSKQDYPVTPAVRYLKEHKISFVPYLFKYEEKGGTKHTAQELKVDEHSVIKTLVFETESGSGLIILMHGEIGRAS